MPHVASKLVTQTNSKVGDPGFTNGNSGISDATTLVELGAELALDDENMSVLAVLDETFPATSVQAILTGFAASTKYGDAVQVVWREDDETHVEVFGVHDTPHTEPVLISIVVSSPPLGEAQAG